MSPLQNWPGEIVQAGGALAKVAPTLFHSGGANGYNEAGRTSLPSTMRPIG